MKYGLAPFPTFGFVCRTPRNDPLQQDPLDGEWKSKRFFGQVYLLSSGSLKWKVICCREGLERLGLSICGIECGGNNFTLVLSLIKLVKKSL